MSVVELAQLVLEVLEAQRRYFDGGRQKSDLIASKQLERRLRAEAEAILNVASMVR